MDPQTLRRSLGMFATGVAIVTTRGTDGALVGMTINSFSSVSLEPPLILFSIAKSALSLAHFQCARSYAVNVLGQGQQALSNRFAQGKGDKWSGVAFRSGLHGAPVFDDALARFECTPHAQVDAGDHVIVVARVEAHITTPDSAPLLFFGGRYHAVAEAA